MPGLSISTAQGFLADLEQKKISLSNLQKGFGQKISEVKALYAAHVRGPENLEVITKKLPSLILENLGVTVASLGNLSDERLHQLFSRSLELPYFVSQSVGSSEKEIYVKLATQLSESFGHRLDEDVFDIGFCGCALEEANVGVDALWLESGKKELKGLQTGKLPLPNIDGELAILEKILEVYGYKIGPTSRLLTNILNCTTHGLLELCVGSLQVLATSWNEPDRVANHIYVQKSYNESDVLHRALDVLYSTLGRHINKITLEEIVANLSEQNHTRSGFEEQEFYI